MAIFRSRSGTDTHNADRGAYGHTQKRNQYDNNRQDNSATTQRPLSAIADAIQQGATTTSEITKITQLSESTVDAALAHLTRIGMMRSSTESSACTECGMKSSCSTSPQGCNETGAHDRNHKRRSGLTTLTLIERPQ
ncbi:Uncharacterised protein [Corynebacterium kutscheri]|uniref:hypothetical protein n=1 Tax=Corynebacterium kutscheri TaxID=35755 RepID=UPI000F6D22BA|nr:hypothetical protein [Corynebacterium kutscheri]VEH81859.1 Uncharacterised protein [Corynebacterium kutscheri]